MHRREKYSHFPNKLIAGLACVLFFYLSAFNTSPVHAFTINNDQVRPLNETEVFEPSPARAAMLSATLPGLGQIYNKRYWKVPVIYAGFGTLAYFIDFNNSNYRKWRNAWIARIDGNPNTVDDFPLHSDGELERAMNFYRRNLEITYMLTAALYLLNILDASVDAHLMTFDVGEDLTLRMEPTTIPSELSIGNTSHSAQFTLRLRF